MHKTSVQFSPCKDPDCKWPTHASFHISGSHIHATTPPIFSKESALAFLKAAVLSELIDGDTAGNLAHEVEMSRLPKDKTCDDRLFETAEIDLAESYANVRYGVIPMVDGSGEARIEICQGECGHAHCGRYPTHALIYITGVPGHGSLFFSDERGLKLVTDYVAYGFLTPSEEQRLIETLEGLSLENEITRADRMVKAGSPFLGKILGYVIGDAPMPPNMKPVEFTICGFDNEDDPHRHGHLRIYGYGCGNPLRSTSGADKLIADLIADGFIDLEHAASVLKEVADSGLPEVSTYEELGSALKTLLTDFFGKNL